MSSWSGFYSVLGGATAALLGLLFVAVSLNAAATFGEANAGSAALAEQAFENYLAVLIVSLLALIPNVSIATFGGIAIAVTGVSALSVVTRFVRRIDASSGERWPVRFQAMRRFASSLLGFGMMMTASVLMAWRQVAELNLFAAASIVLLLSATEVSWAFLKRLARVDGR